MACAHTLTLESVRRENPNGTTPSAYVVNIPPLSNVYGLRVVAVCMANSQYAVNAYNNVVEFYDVALLSSFNAVLTPGNYTGTELASELATKMSTAVGVPGAFTCTYSAITNHLTISRSGATQFRFWFASGTFARYSACKVLGWPPVDTSLATSVESPYYVQLQGEEFVYICFRGVPGMYTSSRVTDAVAQVVFPTGARSADLRSMVAPMVMFSEVQPSLTSLQVSCVRPDGKLYDFNGQEHTITVEVFCLTPVTTDMVA